MYSTGLALGALQHCAPPLVSCGGGCLPPEKCPEFKMPPGTPTSVKGCPVVSGPVVFVTNDGGRGLANITECNNCGSVAATQQMLADLGFLTEADVNGVSAPKTRAAFAAFAATKGIFHSPTSSPEGRGCSALIGAWIGGAQSRPQRTGCKPGELGVPPLCVSVPAGSPPPPKVPAAPPAALPSWLPQPQSMPPSKLREVPPPAPPATPPRWDDNLGVGAKAAKAFATRPWAERSENEKVAIGVSAAALLVLAVAR